MLYHLAQSIHSIFYDKGAYTTSEENVEKQGIKQPGTEFGQKGNAVHPLQYRKGINHTSGNQYD